MLAGAPADTVAALEAYGERVGLAFQLEDDLLGIWGDPAVTGKPALADLRARKKSLPVAAALATGGPAAGRLRDWLATPAPPPDHTVDDLAELRGIAGLVEEAGGRAWAAAEARRQVRAGRAGAVRRAGRAGAPRPSWSRWPGRCWGGRRDRDGGTPDDAGPAGHGTRHRGRDRAAGRRGDRRRRSRTCADCRTRPAGGRATSRPT